MLARGRLILSLDFDRGGSTAIAFAQSGDAEITGIVKDPTGTPIAHAALTLTNLDSGVARTVVSDSDGRYRFFAIPPGRYAIKAEAVGFKTESITGMVLNIGTHLDRDIGLTVGSVQEAITVTGDVPPVDTTKGDVSGVVTNQQIDTLPVNTRQYLNLALLMPGTTQAASRTFYNNVQIGGGDRFYANGFTVDGVTNTWAEQGEPRQNFPEGSVQEFKVNTNQWKAEQGWAMGGVVNVITKSGTNQFHGDAFEYWRDQALNRDNAFQKAGRAARKASARRRSSATSSAAMSAAPSFATSSTSILRMSARRPKIPTRSLLRRAPPSTTPPTRASSTSPATTRWSISGSTTKSITTSTCSAAIRRNGISRHGRDAAARPSRIATTA